VTSPVISRYPRWIPAGIYSHNPHTYVSALRKTILKAHRRAWLWQDEWYGLTMDDIREIERKTQEILRKKLAGTMDSSSAESIDTENQGASDTQKLQLSSNDNTATSEAAATLSSIEKTPRSSSRRTIASRL